MLKSWRWKVVVCIFLLLVLNGCNAKAQLPKVMETTPMTNLDGNIQNPYEPKSPVLQDVYDRSIPEEVYSTD